MAKFFIERPIFAAVIAIVITIAGLISIPILPIAQFPQIAPPTVQVTTTYTGASAAVVEQTVTTPIEEQINGVEGMIYMSSVSTDNGNMVLTVTFDVGYDLDIAAVDVQNRVAIAQAQLPVDVSRYGLTIKKQSPDMTLIVNLISPDQSRDELFLSNYAAINLVDRLKRLDGVGDVSILGERKYSMRIWLDPDKLASAGLSANDIAEAIQAQNIQPAAGQIGQMPAPPGQKFQFSITALGRLESAEEFENIIIRADPGGAMLRLQDVARVELGAENYASFALLDGGMSTNIGIYSLPGANAIAVANGVRAEMAVLAERFPSGVEYFVVYDTTVFVTDSISEVMVTFVEAFLLVFLVVYIFLQDWRATLIPAITIPVSLIGTFAVMNLVGFSTNTLSLFGLVLAIGLVVDDAIVVVENVDRQLSRGGISGRQAAIRAMNEVTGPIIATTLVLGAVFVPVGFVPGTTGQLYKQFALTIAFSVFISSICALTLSPALCAILLRPTNEDDKNRFFTWFNKSFERFRSTYEKTVATLIENSGKVVGLFGIGLLLTVYAFFVVPTGFVPEEDQGYVIVNLQGPDGAALPRTALVTEEVTKLLMAEDGVAHVITIGGYNLLTSAAASNVSTFFAVFEPFDERTTEALSAAGILASLRPKFAKITEADVLAFNPPPIPGLSTTGGFQFNLQDYDAGSFAELDEAAQKLIHAGNSGDIVQSLYTSYRSNYPKLYIDMDRSKALSLGVDVSDVFATLQGYLGAIYINDFNKFGRIYRVFMQADQNDRSLTRDIGKLFVPNADGGMVPLSTLVKIENTIGPQTITHFNLYRSAMINGGPAAGRSSGEAMQEMQRLADTQLPRSMGYEWQGTAFEELKSGNVAPLIFGLALIFVFLFLAAQYESWILPLVILLSVPLAILGALTAQGMRGLANDVYCQIGLVMLIGLASKNAILIVEFAKERREAGAEIIEAALDATRSRVRPILMTAFSFILGVFPMVVASGAGAASRHSLGTAVFGGMLVSTILSLLVVPVFYVLAQGLRERFSGTAQSANLPDGA
jgi:hydrophobe/amphiphile efflux-1 (HAE1) family protein